MSWLFSQALGAEYLAATCSDGEPFAQLNVMPTQHKFWYRDKTMEFSDLSRFGLTCAVLTEDRGAELLTWFRAGFPVRTLAVQDMEKESTENEADFGPRWQGSFARYSPASCSWKTPQGLLDGGLAEFSETWPAWGLMRDGECLALDISLPLTYENESGFWPTPVKTDGYAVGWCEVSIKRKEAGETRPSGARIGSGLKYDRRTHPYLSNGYPNPQLPEWLMGWMPMWTGLQPLETDKFHEWQQQHGACFHPIKTHERQS